MRAYDGFACRFAAGSPVLRRRAYERFAKSLYGRAREEKRRKMSDKDKVIFGICKVNEKGQIVIPKEAREAFGIKSGDSLILLGDLKKGLALVKADVFSDAAEEILKK